MREQLTFKNQKVQELRRLIGRRSSRSDARAFAVEGEVLIREAIDADWNVLVEFVAPGADPVSDAAVFELGDGVLERVASTERPQPNLAVVAMPERSIDLSTIDLAIVADRLSDPGNLGTILRSAEAAGVDVVVVTPGSVDPYNPKVVRATAGALFHIPVVEADLAAVRAAGLRLIGTSSHQGDPHTTADWTGRIAIVMGSEAHGLAADAPIDQWVRIEHRGRAESLNVAMATTLLAFEAARQR